ncbi:hypothetical protein [Azospirillum sp. Marseille-Q6669]
MIHRKNPLELLGEKYQPSKRNHNYLQHYWTHFRDIAHEVRNVCEIGVQTDRSVRMWEEFFPNATIHGVDIDPDCKRFEQGRIRIHIGDQSDRSFLEKLVAEAGAPFDIVIDDGSHIPRHQIDTFDFLFPRMSEHGVYALEDTGGCVGDYGNRVINHLRSLTDAINHWPEGFRPQDWPFLSEFTDDAPWQARNVVGVAFYRWIAFVFRGQNPRDNPYLRSLAEMPRP